MTQADKELLKQRIIDALNLEDIAPADIDDAAPLFGEGLGLDSIDALEITIILERYYNIKLTSPSENRQIFASINSLSQFIDEKQA